MIPTDEDGRGDRYDWCPLRMIDLWWSAWKNIWLFIGAECGWRVDLHGHTRVHRTEWELQISDDRFVTKDWWRKAYGLEFEAEEERFRVA